jgi:hypothetical protein
MHTALPLHLFPLSWPVLVGLNFQVTSYCQSVHEVLIQVAISEVVTVH